MTNLLSTTVMMYFSVFPLSSLASIFPALTISSMALECPKVPTTTFALFSPASMALVLVVDISMSCSNVFAARITPRQSLASTKTPIVLSLLSNRSPPEKLTKLSAALVNITAKSPRSAVRMRFLKVTIFYIYLISDAKLPF